LKEMLVISKFATAHGAVEFLRRPIHLFTEALEVSQGRTDGKEVSGWWTRWRISSKDIVERRRGDGRASASTSEGGATGGSATNGNVGNGAGGEEDVNR